MVRSTSITMPTVSDCTTLQPWYTTSFVATSLSVVPGASVCMGLIVVLQAEVRDQLLAPQVPQRVLQLHELDEQVVLGIEAGRGHGALEVEREPLLDAAHARAAGQVEEQRQVQD